MAAPILKYRLVVPTALNMLNVANENIVTNLRRRRSSNLQLPSLFRLAFQVVHVSGEVVLQIDQDAES